MVIEMRYTIYNKNNEKIFECEDSLLIFNYHMENRNILAKIEIKNDYVITTFKNGNKEYMKTDTYNL